MSNKKINVLIVSSSDLAGGAALAAYRMHKALLDTKEVECSMLVQNKSSDAPSVITETTKLRKNFNKIRPALERLPINRYKDRTPTLFSSAWLGFSNIAEKINEINPDIVHFHWICNGMVSIEEIGKIKAPIIWNCQDMWPFTGGCHYNEDCENYKESCHNCKVLGSRKKYDLSSKIFKRKAKTYSKLGVKLVFNGVSRWIAGCAASSALTKQNTVVNIPNCVDPNVFKSMDKEFVRKLFNIPIDKKVILFGAQNPLGDPRKGGKELFEALKKLSQDKNVVFVIAGSSGIDGLNLGRDTYFIPQLHDETSLALLYNIADVMIVPSLQENLSNSIIESLSSKVPVVAFDIGGNSDMIEHKKNGYLAKPLDTDDLSTGIEWVINNEKYDELCNYARTKVLNNFSPTVVTKKYIEMYKTMLEIKNDSV